MSKHIFALVVLALSYSFLYACDACSCTSMNSLDGQVLPNKQSFIGWSTSYIHQTNSEQSKINNISNSLFGAFKFSKSWQILAALPLQQNYLKEKEASWSSQVGLGDASVVLGYSPIFKKSMLKDYQQSLILRAGLKVPTGYYHVDNTSNANFGTKSFDFLLSAQYVYQKNNQGINLSVNSRINTKNKYAYKYGSRIDVSAFYFVQRTKNTLAYMPFFGASGEYNLKDTSNGFIREFSGGGAMYGITGFLLNFNSKFSLYSKIELPLVQNFSGINGPIYNTVKAQIQGVYFFNNKIISKKTKSE
ncbi:MAG: hypothetical protein R2772_07685 [Chitinophagales bacterium]